jgi:hypothetical protein
MERESVGLSDRGDQAVACLLAAAADFCANAAVLVVGRMPLALLATGAAGHGARLDRCADDAEIGCRLAGQNAAGRVADVGAVEIEANAADQLLHVSLGEADVGAARAGGRTVEALVDTAQEHVEIKAGGLRVRLDHFSNCHVLSVPSTGV